MVRFHSLRITSTLTSNDFLQPSAASPCGVKPSPDARGVAYTDGSYDPIKKVGGWAVVMHDVIVSGGLQDVHDSTVPEVTAVGMAMTPGRLCRLHPRSIPPLLKAQ
eukprot:TRINITY_DN436_c0_g1_i2.p1 TRINITY_DN436_c0_g1~~TRINITY_DN436_c0_g1_i2.p1  ORF type:complete len:106 (-),score=1.15 TRINITY_DN436_c0_g1_i2:252-569(-)